MKEIMRPVLVASVCILVVSWILTQIPSCQKPKPDDGYYGVIVPEVDTITPNKPYVKPNPPKDPKPVVHTVIKWLKPETPVYSPDITFNKDSLVRIIDSLKNDTVRIKRDYFYYHPKAPKLLYAKLTSNSLRLDLLKTDGEIYSDIYPIDFSKSDYVFDDGELSSINPGKKKRLLQKSTVVFVGGEVLTKSQFIGLEQRYQYGSLEAALNAIGTIQSKPRAYIGGKVGIILHGKKGRRE